VRKRFWALVAVALTAAFGGAWTWLHRAVDVDFSCGDGTPAESAGIYVFVSSEHGGATAMLTQGPGGAELTPGFSGPSRHLEMAERDALLARMRRPGAAARDVVRRGKRFAVLEVTKTCHGVARATLEKVPLSDLHAGLAAWLETPGDLELLEAVIGRELADHDPHTAEVAAAAEELLSAAYAQ
jgi:hypothetical protein